MNPEYIVLSKVSQTQKNNAVCFHLNEVLKIVKIIEIDYRMVMTRDWARGNGIYYLMGIEFQVYKMKSIMRMDGANGCTT